MVVYAGLDSWHLASIESLASSCRSVVLAVAIMHVSSTQCACRNLMLLVVASVYVSVTQCAFMQLISLMCACT